MAWHEASEGVAHDVETSGEGREPQEGSDGVLEEDNERRLQRFTVRLSGGYLPSPELLALLQDPVVTQVRHGRAEDTLKLIRLSLDRRRALAHCIISDIFRTKVFSNSTQIFQS